MDENTQPLLFTSHNFLFNLPAIFNLLSISMSQIFQNPLLSCGKPLILPSENADYHRCQTKHLACFIYAILYDVGWKGLSPKTNIDLSQLAAYFQHQNHTRFIESLKMQLEIMQELVLGLEACQTGYTIRVTEVISVVSIIRIVTRCLKDNHKCVSLIQFKINLHMSGVSHLTTQLHSTECLCQCFNCILKYFRNDMTHNSSFHFCSLSLFRLVAVTMHHVCMPNRPNNSRKHNRFLENRGETLPSPLLCASKKP